jgi:hypothetical protein
MFVVSVAGIGTFSLNKGYTQKEGRECTFYVKITFQNIRGRQVTELASLKQQRFTQEQLLW